MSKHTIKKTSTYTGKRVNVAASKKAGVVFKLGHSWDDRIVTEEATCVTHLLGTKRLGRRIHVTTWAKSGNVEVHYVNGDAREGGTLLRKKVAPAKVEALVAAILNGDHDAK